MTEYGRGPGSEPWHPEDPLYGDGGWGGQQAQAGQQSPYGGQPQHYPQQPQQQTQPQQQPQQQTQYGDWGDGGQGAYGQQQYGQQQGYAQDPYATGGHGETPAGGVWVPQQRTADDPYGGELPPEQAYPYQGDGQPQGPGQGYDEQYRF